MIKKYFVLLGFICIMYMFAKNTQYLSMFLYDSLKENPHITIIPQQLEEEQIYSGK